MQLHGDPSGPGAGQVWISGQLQVTAVPFIAPPPSDFAGSFSAPVTVTGTVSGYSNTNLNQPPLFTVNVVGQGMAFGQYRYIDNSGGDPFYLDNCCAGVTISTLPQPWSYTDIGFVGQRGSASYSNSVLDEKFTVQAAGADIWGSADSFGYLYQPLVGDGWVSVGILSLQNTNSFAKAGLMLRESFDSSSAHVILDVRPDGQTEFMTRASAGSPTEFVAGSTETLPTWLQLYRHGSVVTGYVLGDGWRKTIGSTTVPMGAMGRNLLVGVAVTSHDATTLTTSTFRPPFVHHFAFGLPQGWTDSDIGAVGQPGLSSYDAGTYTVHGAGADIWGTADAFHFLSQGLSGDGQIVARVTGVESTNSFAKAGIMMRLGPGGASDSHVVLDLRPTGDIEFMTRSSVGQSTTFIAGVSQQAPVWLKLALSGTSGTTISGSVSTDGLHWTVLGATDPNFAEMHAGDGSVAAGLVVTSHDASTLNTSTFDNVAITNGSNPAALPRFWANRDVGTTGLPGTAAYEGGVFTVRGAGADIWGTADAFQQVYQRVDSDTDDISEYPIQHVQVTARVMSVTDTNMFAKAGIMIRDSEAPNAANVILDVRPTGDIEFMSRASTGAPTTYLGGTSLALPGWLKLVRTGATVAGYVSSDGVSWTLVGNAATDLSNSTTQVGPVVTSHDPGALNTATFDHVDVRIPQ